MGIFESLAVMLALCAVFGWIAKILKFPPLLGYIVAGFVISAIGGGHSENGRHTIEILGKLGVTLLLFLAGMELPVDNLLRVGKTAFVTGFGQITITASLGYVLAVLLGFSSIESFYIGIALTFGSTIIVVKLLSEKKELQSLHGKLATGFLLVQDFVAVALLSLLTTIKPGGFDMSDTAFLALKVVLLFGLAIFLSTRVMPIIARHVASSVELLFVSSIGWCLVVATIVSLPVFGLSFEIGGFLAGLALASSVEQGQIIARIKPLRDFFLTWFFVALGAGLSFEGVWAYLGMGVIFVIFVLVVNPLVVTALLSIQGYKRRTAFLAGVSMSSVSEFSLILLVAVGSNLLPLMTLVAVGTMALSTYLVWHDKKIYRFLFGNTGHDYQDEKNLGLTGHVVLFGHNRIGSVLRPVLSKLGHEVVVVDFDPNVVDELKKENVRVVYGDMADHDLYERLDLEEAQTIISTVPDVHDSLSFLHEIRKKNKKQVVIVTATDQNEARLLYEAGASYVLIPHAVGGEFLASTLNGENGMDFRKLIGRLGEQHKERLAV